MGIVWTPRSDRAANARFSVVMLPKKTSRTATVESWDIRTALAQLSHGCRSVPVQSTREIARISCSHPTSIPQWPHHGRARTLRSVLISPPRVRTKIARYPYIMYITFAVAHSHLRSPKNRTENRRRIYRTAPTANVN